MHFDIEKLFDVCPSQMHWIGRLTRMNYEPEMRFLSFLCDRSKVSVDIGAKVGMYAYRMMKHSLYVHAFEPLPLLAGILRKSLKGNICVHEMALSDRNGSVDIRVPRNKWSVVKPGRSTIEAENLLAGFPPENISTIPVKTVTLDEMEISNIGFIKIDVEGHEASVVGGGIDTIGINKPNMIVEVNEAYKEKAMAAVTELLYPHGYKCWVVLDGRLTALHEAGANRLEDKENFIFSTNLCIGG